MPFRQLADAPAQSNTASGAAITAAQTSVTLQSASGFPAILANGQLSVTILDGGNPAFNPAAPLNTPFEYQQVNGISGNVLTFGPGGGSASRVSYAGTTPRAFLSGSIPNAPIIAAGMLAEDIVASSTWKFDEQILGAAAPNVRIPAAGSIPPTYLGITWRHLEIIWTARSDQASVTTLNAQLNGDNANHYFNQDNLAAGVVVGTSANTTASSARVGTLGTTADPFSSGKFVIPFYTIGPRINFLYEALRNDVGVTNNFGSEWGVSGWSGAAPVTSILLFPFATGNFVAGTVFTTYLKP